MESACPKLEAALREVELSLPAVPVISNVTAQPHATAGEILNRLVEQVTSSVRWEASIRHLIDDGVTLIELGLGNALTGFMRRIDRSLKCTMYPTCRAWKNGCGIERLTLLTTHKLRFTNYVSGKLNRQ